MYINISLSKKVLRKIIKYLIIFIIGCIIIFYANTLNVNAQSIPSNCHFYDNMGNSQTYLLTIGGVDYWKPENSFTLTANSYGGLIICTLDTPLVKDNLYSLSMYVELEGTSAEAKLSSKPNLGIGNSFEDARSSYINNTNTTLKYSSASANNLSYIFTANTDASFIAIPFGSNSTVTTTPKLTNLSIISQGNANNLTQNDIQNIISNSNEELKDSIENSNEELKDTITDIFTEDCHPSNNLLPFLNGTWSTRGLTMTAKNGIYDISGTFNGTAGGITVDIPDFTLQPGTYTINLNRKGTAIYPYFTLQGDQSIGIRDGKSITFTLDSAKTFTQIYFYFGTTSYNSQYSIMLSIGSTPQSFEQYGIQVCNNKLDDLKDNQQATNDKLDDLNDSLNNSDTNGANDSANSFFDNFQSTDHGGISGIVSAPLELIKSLINNNNTCSNLNFTVFEKAVYFPSGCVLWDKVPDSFITIWNILVCGLGSYGILIALFKDIEKLKTPDSKGVDTLDL